MEEEKQFIMQAKYKRRLIIISILVLISILIGFNYLKFISNKDDNQSSSPELVDKDPLNTESDLVDSSLHEPQEAQVSIEDASDELSIEQDSDIPLIGEDKIEPEN